MLGKLEEVIDHLISSVLFTYLGLLPYAAVAVSGQCKPTLDFISILDTEDTYIFLFSFPATLRNEFSDSGAFALDKTCLVHMALGQWNINRFLMQSVSYSFFHSSEQE